MVRCHTPYGIINVMACFMVLVVILMRSMEWENLIIYSLSTLCLLIISSQARSNSNLNDDR